MLENIFLALGGLAFLIMIISIKWESLTLVVFDIILWFTLALSVIHIEIPYQYVKNGEVFTETHIVESMASLSWVFVFLGFFMLLYAFYLAWDFFKGKDLGMM